MVHRIFETKPRPKAFICASASGYYGPRGNEPVDELEPPGSDWLAEVCARWERQAETAKVGIRLVLVRTGVVLDAEGGALAKMLPPFKAGVGGPIGSGKQYMPWIHLDDLVGIYLAAIDHRRSTARSTPRRPEPGDQQAVRQGARAARCQPPRGRAGARLHDQAHVRRDAARSCSTACGWCPGAPPSSATSFATPISTRRCAAPSTADRGRRAWLSLAARLAVAVGLGRAARETGPTTRQSEPALAGIDSQRAPRRR